MSAAVRLTWAVFVVSISGCVGLPSYDLTGDRSLVAPAGPKVASLVANLKCELWQAVNSTQVLPRYADSPRLQTINGLRGSTDSDERHPVDTPAERQFTLRNYFEEIQYVADVGWTLDVTLADSLNPSLTGNKYFRGAASVFPATRALLSVEGTVSDTGHRFVTFYQAVDLSRLSWSPRPDDKPGDPRGLARNLADCANTDAQAADTSPNQGGAYQPAGNDLQGELGLRETLATAIIAASMSDISLLPPPIQEGEARGQKAPPAASPIKNDGDAAGRYTFGVITTQVDFTVVQSAGLGANWVLRFFSFPNASSPPLLGASRTVKDQLVITFVPICIRRKYSLQPSRRTDRSLEYTPAPMDGSPPWMNYLRPCEEDGTPERVASNVARASRALATARAYNLLRLQGGPFPIQ